MRRDTKKLKINLVWNFETLKCPYDTNFIIETINITHVIVMVYPKLNYVCITFWTEQTDNGPYCRAGKTKQYQC